MSGIEYIKDKLLLLLLHIGCMSALTAFLRLTGYPPDYCKVILLCWCFILAAWLLEQFFVRRDYFREIEKVMENLERRYLLGELMPSSFRLEDRLYHAIIKKSNKSVIERIRQLEEAQKEYREYIESWVHEIKTPITGIALNCENHRDERSRYIAAENGKIENYVDMALYYARSDDVYKDYMIAEANLQEIAEDLLIRNKHYLIQCGMRAEVECPHVVFTDKKWIGFILNQLLQNSVKYRRREDAYVRIVSERKAQGVILKVQDNGIGIKAEEMNRIFEKGFTGTNGRGTQRSTGMGLYLCYKLAKKLGINIRGESTEGEGTEMILEFPVSSYLSKL